MTVPARAEAPHVDGVVVRRALHLLALLGRVPREDLEVSMGGISTYMVGGISTFSAEYHVRISGAA